MKSHKNHIESTAPQLSLSSFCGRGGGRGALCGFGVVHTTSTAVFGAPPNPPQIIWRLSALMQEGGSWDSRCLFLPTRDSMERLCAMGRMESESDTALVLLGRRCVDGREDVCPKSVFAGRAGSFGGGVRAVRFGRVSQAFSVATLVS
jgi:hypothetical protein